MDELTNDAKYLLARLYEVYIERRKQNIPKEKATYFGDYEDLKITLMSEWSLPDVLYTCRELLNNGYLDAMDIKYKIGESFFEIHLTPKAIMVMENKFQNNVKKVIDYALKIKSLIF